MTFMVFEAVPQAALTGWYFGAKFLNIGSAFSSKCKFGALHAF
jgi:hypothetical protein